METLTDSSSGAIIKSDRTGRTRYTVQYKREVLDAFESSSLSVSVVSSSIAWAFATTDSSVS